jgi:hypothetical protein
MSIRRVVAVSVIVAALSSACGTTAPTSPSSSAPNPDLAFCVAEINRYRALANQPAVNASPALDASAAEAAYSDATSNHPHEWQQTHRFVAMEDFRAPLFGNVQDTIGRAWNLFWHAGPGWPDYDAMTSDKVREVGCGVYVSPGEVTTVALFR